MKYKIIMISGAQSSGKTTLSKELSELIIDQGKFPKQLKFAAPLYELHDYTLNKMERWTGKRPETKCRVLLQSLGTEFGRSTYGENVWAEICRKEADKFLGLGYIVIIDDCRFENEFDIFPDALRIRLECPEDIRKERSAGAFANPNHQSEQGLNEYLRQGKFDRVFHTNMVSPREIANCLILDIA